MNLLYCGNEKVFDGLLISLLSVLKHTKSVVNVYVMTMDLTHLDQNHRPIQANQIAFFEKILLGYHPQNQIHSIDATMLFEEEMKDSANMKNFYTPYCMLRLFCDKVEQLPDKLLYLDTDTVALKDIKELYEIKLGDCEYAGAIDYLGKIFKNPRYINSGVLLLNLPRIRQTGLLAKTRACCNTKRMAFPDQDALNRYAKKKKRIPSCYNHQRCIHKNTVIRHFCKSLRLLPYPHTVNIKPWDIDGIHAKLHIHDIDDLLNEYKEKRQQFENQREREELA